MNKLLVLVLLAIPLSLFSIPSSANAEIKITAPLNWQPDAIDPNNPDSMRWHQNSTQSIFAIVKGAENIPFSLASVGPLLAQYAAPLLESADELSFGHGNYGYRYFLNLSSSKVLNETSGSPLEGLIADMIPDTHDLTFKGMLILAEKQGDMYVISLLSPRQNFDSVLKELKPTIDSIQLSNSTVTN